MGTNSVVARFATVSKSVADLFFTEDRNDLIKFKKIDDEVCSLESAVKKIRGGYLWTKDEVKDMLESYDMVIITNPDFYNCSTVFMKYTGKHSRYFANINCNLCYMWDEDELDESLIMNKWIVSGFRQPCDVEDYSGVESFNSCFNDLALYYPELPGVDYDEDGRSKYHKYHIFDTVDDLLDTWCSDGVFDNVVYPVCMP